MEILILVIATILSFILVAFVFIIGFAMGECHGYEKGKEDWE